MDLVRQSEINRMSKSIPYSLLRSSSKSRSSDRHATNCHEWQSAQCQAACLAREPESRPPGDLQDFDNLWKQDVVCTSLNPLPTSVGSESGPSTRRSLLWVCHQQGISLRLQCRSAHPANFCRAIQGKMRANQLALARFAFLAKLALVLGFAKSCVSCQLQLNRITSLLLVCIFDIQQTVQWHCFVLINNPFTDMAIFRPFGIGRSARPRVGQLQNLPQIEVGQFQE